MDHLQKSFRLHESLFFNPRMAIVGSWEGRTCLNSLLERWANILIQLLQVDPLKGNLKILAKYLLTATKGPESQVTFGQIRKVWQQEDNRSSYRARLTEAVKAQLNVFAVDCGQLRKQVERAARLATEEEEEVEEAKTHEDRQAQCEHDIAEMIYSFPERLKRESYKACHALLQMPKDQVTIPDKWQVESFWKRVQERQVLRYDPLWSLEITDGASCFLQLLRLGVPKDPTLKMKREEACVVSSIAEYSQLRQVQHAQMKELYARGYVTYSNLCNKPFQEKMKQIVARAQASGVFVEVPEEVVAAKRLQRILEKTLEAEQERAGWDWPERSELYLQHTYCFYILDTVRMSFSCRGETVPEQVHCCMRVLEEFQHCSVETDGVQLLRTKSGFAAGVTADGGYADVKLLCYADLGSHVAFDGTEIPLRIIGEIQLILEDYEAVKKRMHLVYEVNRGSFDRAKASSKRVTDRTQRAGSGVT